MHHPKISEKKKLNDLRDRSIAACAICNKPKFN